MTRTQAETELNTILQRLGETYPRPLVDHHQARDRALATLAKLKTVA